MSLANSQSPPTPPLPLQYAPQSPVSLTAWVRRLALVILLVAAQSTLSRVLFFQAISTSPLTIAPKWLNFVRVEFSLTSIDSTLAIVAAVMALSNAPAARTLMLIWAWSSILCATFFLAVHLAGSASASNIATPQYPVPLTAHNAVARAEGSLFVMTLPLLVAVFYRRQLTAHADHPAGSNHPLHSVLTAMAVLLLLRGILAVAINAMDTAVYLMLRPTSINQSPQYHIAIASMGLVTAASAIVAAVACLSHVAFARFFLLIWICCDLTLSAIALYLNTRSNFTNHQYLTLYGILRSTSSIFTGVTLPLIVWLLFTGPQSRPAFDRRS